MGYFARVPMRASVWVQSILGSSKLSQCYSPSAQVNQRYPSGYTLGNTGAVLIKHVDLVMSLVELGRKDDFVPDRQTIVIVQQLVWQCWRVLCVVGSSQDLSQARLDCVPHAASSNVNH